MYINVNSLIVNIVYSQQSLRDRSYIFAEVSILNAFNMLQRLIMVKQFITLFRVNMILLCFLVKTAAKFASAFIVSTLNVVSFKKNLCHLQDNFPANKKLEVWHTNCNTAIIYLLATICAISIICREFR